MFRLPDVSIGLCAEQPSPRLRQDSEKEKVFKKNQIIIPNFVNAVQKVGNNNNASR